MSRLRRRFTKSGDDDPDSAADSADLSDQEHAWWASRSRLMHTFGYIADSEPPAEPEVPAGPGDPWTYQSVFQHAMDGKPEPGERPATGSDQRNLAEVFVEESAYRVLELDPEASWEEVVASHRRIAKKYHPDRLINADPITREDGEQKMRAANAAYEKLRKQPRAQTSGLFGS